MAKPKKKPQPSIEFHAEHSVGEGITLTIATGSETKKLSLSWGSALALQRELEMAVNFSSLQFKGTIVEMLRKEEERRAEKETRREARTKLVEAAKIINEFDERA